MKVSGIKYKEMQAKSIMSRYVCGDSKKITIHIGKSKDSPVSYKDINNAINKEILELVDEGALKKGSEAVVIDLPGNEYPICIVVEVDNDLKLLASIGATTGITRMDLCNVFTDIADSLV